MTFGTTLVLRSMILALPRCYAAQIGSLLTTFRANLLALLQNPEITQCKTCLYDNSGKWWNKIINSRNVICVKVKAKSSSVPHLDFIKTCGRKWWSTQLLPLKLHRLWGRGVSGNYTHRPIYPRRSTPYLLGSATTGLVVVVPFLSRAIIPGYNKTWGKTKMLGEEVMLKIHMLRNNERNDFSSGRCLVRLSTKTPTSLRFAVIFLSPFRQILE